MPATKSGLAKQARFATEVYAMKETLYFYDLETSGVNARKARIMQFAGQRTDMDFNPIGEPHNVLIKITDDILPEPDAVLITGITPQKTIAEGVTEAEFCQTFATEIAKQGTTFVGFNNIRFDDEFMRFLLYRNFYDAYEWQWKNGSSKWDLLDVVRMARALRPDGVTWPKDAKGNPTNRLELLTSANNLGHDNAHDALSDVHATIAVAKLIKEKQPKLFEYLLTMRDKKKVMALVNQNKPFVYVSGKYPGEFEKATIAVNLGSHPDKQGGLVYDLRHDPEEFLSLSPEKLAERWKWKKDAEEARLPVKAIQFNRCPAVAPLTVLDDSVKERLQLDMNGVESNLTTLQNEPKFIEKIYKALTILNKDREQTSLIPDEQAAEASLYQSFVPDGDKRQFDILHQSKPEEIMKFQNTFTDDRLKMMVPHYKARNYPKSLTDEERTAWESYRSTALTSGGEQSSLARFGARLAILSTKEDATDEQRYLLEELNLYAQSILPNLEG